MAENHHVLGLPLKAIDLPRPCSVEKYQQVMGGYAERI